MQSFCNRVIEYSFYALFLLVPLVFLGNTSELFEFNKMWLTFGLTIVIGSVWVTKMILQGRIAIQKTPLDIPILLFFASQVISTIFSLDPHISWWGYYSRFNGGLLSTISYILLYYAFVSNLTTKHVLRVLGVSLVSCLLVALWGFPARFGYDPTCLVFRGTLDVNCWTDAFKPTIRTFSTLGQPAWLAAYLATLLPLSMVYALKAISEKQKAKSKLLVACFLSLAALFYISLIFANTRAGFIGFFAADAVLWLAIFWGKLFPWKRTLTYFATLHLVIVMCSFFFGMPTPSLDKFTFKSLTTPTASAPVISITDAPTTAQPASKPKDQASADSKINITDSADIRKLVWTGAISAWKDNPIFGTGVETFAFAYYKYKPAAHNLTSEWDFLYNKAHNEYLNYLATTGIFGLGSYLLIIFFLILQTSKWLIAYRVSKENNENHKPYAMRYMLIASLLAGYISILVTNFFGFSVVIVNLYLFLIPAFFYILADRLDSNKTLSFGASEGKYSKEINPYQWTGIVVIAIFAGYFHLVLINYWSADIDYALGANLNKVGQYQQGYESLVRAVSTKPDEPVFQDEFSQSLAVIANGLSLQKDTTNAEKFANNAVGLSDQIVKAHPNNVVYWKNRVRLLYTLSQSDLSNKQAYMTEAVRSIDKAQQLAPNDAKISYNQGVLHGQVGDIQGAIKILNFTIKLKPDYRDAYYALGLFYHELAVDKDNKIIDPAMNTKAIETFIYILNNLAPNDKEVKETLKNWGAGTK